MRGEPRWYVFVACSLNDFESVPEMEVVWVRDICGEVVDQELVVKGDAEIDLVRDACSYTWFMYAHQRSNTFTDGRVLGDRSVPNPPCMSVWRLLT